MVDSNTIAPCVPAARMRSAASRASSTGPAQFTSHDRAMISCICAGSLTRAGSPANTTSPYNAGAASSSRLRSAARVRSARTSVATPVQLWARSELARYPITSRAPSAASSSAAAEPSPPDPPASTISRPRSVSGNRALLLARFDCGRFHRYIPTRHYGEEHGEHFAVAKIQLEQSLEQHRDHHGDGCVQHEFGIVAARRQLARLAQKIEQDLCQH